MPSQSIHAPACLITAALSVPAALILGASPWQSLQVGAGCVMGIIVSPDLDLVNPLRRVPVVGWLWGAYWWPYRRALRHREIGSHLPGLGTFVRAVCMIPFWWALWECFGLGFGWMLAGLAVADTVHALLDAWWIF
jgi:uncharacterized metal-binding protein